jgi:hypothetical protein
MAQEAEQRQKQRAQLDLELEIEKNELKKKKQALKEIQDKDIMLKKEVNKARDALYNSTNDFQQKHIMSYCFDPKENKSYKLGRRND